MKEGIKRSAISRHIVLILASFLLLMGMFALLIAQSNKAYAAVDPQVYEGITWEITDDGVLKIGRTQSGASEPGTVRREMKPDIGDTVSEREDRDRDEMTRYYEEKRAQWPWLKDGRISQTITAVVIVDKIKIVGSMDYMFSHLPNVTSITGLEKIDTSDVNSMSSLFTIKKWEYDGEKYRWAGYGCPNLTELTGYEDWDVKNVVAFSSTFSNLKALTGTIDLSKWETPKAKTIGSMFADTGVEKIKLSEKFDTSNVIYMGSVFHLCRQLTEIDSLQYFDTSKVQTMEWMFANCYKLENIDVSGFVTKNVRWMDSMFKQCSVLKSLDLSSFDTSKVENMNDMFKECTRIESIIGLDKFDTSKVKEMRGMFRATRPAASIDMLSFDMSSVTNADDMLRGATGIITVLQDAIDNGDYSDEAKQGLQLALDEFTPIKYTELTGANAIDVYNSIASHCAYAAIEDTIPMAQQAISDALAAETAAKAAQDRAEANPTPNNIVNAKIKAEEADNKLKAAHSAADKVSRLANSTGVDEHKAMANELQNALLSGAESLAQERISKELTNDLANAKAINTTNFSKASVNTLAKAIENAEKVLKDYAEGNADAESLSEAKTALNNAIDNLEPKSDDEKAADTAIKAAEDALKEAKEAKKAADEAKKKADDLAKSNPGSDEAIKAAEEATAKAAEAQKKAAEAQKAAADAVKAAEATGDEGKIAAAGELKTAADAAKAEADKAKADASSLEAEQKLKKAEAEIAKDPNSDAAKKAAEEAKKAADQAVADNTAAYGPTAPQTQAAVTTQNAAAEAVKTTGTEVDPIGTTFEASKNTYKITVKPGATWDGEAMLIKAKNAKNITVPKTVSYNGKTYEINRVGKGAFRSKKIRKVTLGANVEKIDAGAFQKSKATSIVVKTKSLKKASVKKSLKGSKVKTVKVKVGTKKTNKKYVKKYKKIFTKKNAGKKVTVK